MSEKFTVEYALSAIGIPWLRGRALRAARGQERHLRKVRYLHEAIDSFSWGDSEEGGDFWSSVWQWSRGSNNQHKLSNRTPLKGDLPGIPGQEPVRVKRVDSLSLIPNGIGDLAVRRALESQWGAAEGDSDMAGITSSFDFDRTPEGYAFWMEVSRWVVGMSSLPRVSATTDDGNVTATDVLGLLPPDVAKLALAHPELGEVEVVSRGETYATVKSAEGHVRFVKIEELSRA